MYRFVSYRFRVATQSSVQVGSGCVLIKLVKLSRCHPLISFPYQPVNSRSRIQYQNQRVRYLPTVIIHSVGHDLSSSTSTAASVSTNGQALARSSNLTALSIIQAGSPSSKLSS